MMINNEAWVVLMIMNMHTDVVYSSSRHFKMSFSPEKCKYYTCAPRQTYSELLIPGGISDKFHQMIPIS